VTGDALEVYATAAAQHQEDPHNSSSAQFLEDLNRRTGIRAYLFDEEGHEISGYAAATRRDYPLWLRNRLDQLVIEARRNGQAEFDFIGPTLVAQSARAPSHRVYVLAGTLPATRYGPWQAAPNVQALRLVAVLLVAGAVSWVLARQLTIPVEKLRTATHRLAAGDFSARTDIVPHRRLNEVGELSLDFNAMAERIETLLQAREQLLTAQRRLLGDVAHELRSPLARATVALELARDQVTAIQGEGSPSPRSEAAEISESLDRIELEVARLRALIDRLLVLARLESGVLRPGEELIDLSPLIQSVAVDADYEARPSRHVLACLDGGSCFVCGTSDLLRSAVENIVRNAARHTQENTSVQVTLSVEDEADESAARWQPGPKEEPCHISPLPESIKDRWAVIAVRDHGPGIPTDELEAVFQPFYRSGDRNPRSGGVGLGLTIAARAIALHGGQFRACNAPGGGLLVEIRLPLGEMREVKEGMRGL
jgi:two-component system sensor histidine kinase CpxA